MNDNRSAGGTGLFSRYRRRELPEIQTRDTEEKRPFRYMAFRVGIRSAMLGIVFAEIILIGPILPVWLAMAALIYAVDRIHISLDTRDRPDIYIKYKPDLRRDPRFMGLTGLAIFGEMIIREGIWFPVWFPSYNGFLWWQTANAAGRILPGLGSFMVWMKFFIVAGIPIGLWDPLRVLDWVYKIESVWTQYRNTQFTLAGPSDIETPMGELHDPPAKPGQSQAPLDVRLTSTPILPDTGDRQVKAIQREQNILDL